MQTIAKAVFVPAEAALTRTNDWGCDRGREWETEQESFCQHWWSPWESSVKEHPSVAAKDRWTQNEYHWLSVTSISVLSWLCRNWWRTNRWEIHSSGPTEQLENKQLTGWERVRRRSRWWEKRQRRRAPLNEHQKSQLREVNKHMCIVHTYIDHIRDIMDVILCHNCICCCQVQQIVIPGFCAFQLILWILGLPLERRDETEQTRRKPSVQENQAGVFECVCVCVLRQLQVWDHQTSGDEETGSREDVSKYLVPTAMLPFSHFVCLSTLKAAECGCWQRSP